MRLKSMHRCISNHLILDTEIVNFGNIVSYSGLNGVAFHELSETHERAIHIYSPHAFYCHTFIVFIHNCKQLTKYAQMIDKKPIASHSMINHYATM